MSDQTDPTLRDVQRDLDAAREHDQVKDQILDEFPRQMRRIAAQAGNRQARIIGAVTIIIAILVALIASWVAISIAQDARSTSAATQQQVDAALVKLQEANRALEARGQQPVQPPPDPDPAGAIAAAVLAQVLAQLPPSPTAEQVADRLTAAVLADVLGELRPEVARQTAAYLAANPPRDGKDGETPPCFFEPTQCRGEKGETGEQGPQGEQGEPGEPGEPAPAVTAQTFHLADGSTINCTRTGGADTAPTFACTTTEPTPDSPGNSNGNGLGAGLGAG